MPSIKTIYPDTYLKPEHLRGKTHTVTIETVYVDNFWNPRDQEKQPALVVRMKGKKLPFILNKTQTFQIAGILSNEDYGLWSGGAICLQPAKVRGKNTILVTAPDGNTPPPPPTVEHPDADDDTGDQHPEASNGTDHPDGEDAAEDEDDSDA